MEYCFVEMKSFTDRIVELELEDDLRKLEDHLRRNPTAGALDPGACGLRKVRMGDATRRRGKRSGLRVHYFYVPHRRTIYFVSIFRKDEQRTLTSEQKRMLCALVQRMTLG